MQRNCIMIVEDSDEVADALRTVVEDMGAWSVCIARTVQQAVDAANAHLPILILMDLKLEGSGDGVDAAEQIHDTYGCPIIFLTANTDPTAIRRIFFQGQPAAVLIKPFSAAQLENEIRTVLS